MSKISQDKVKPIKEETTETPTTPQPQSAPPVLSCEAEIYILKAHRNALIAQAQKTQADAHFEKTVSELNLAIQSVIQKHGVGTIPGLQFNLDTLEFSFGE